MLTCQRGGQREKKKKIQAYKITTRGFLKKVKLGAPKVETPLGPHCQEHDVNSQKASITLGKAPNTCIEFYILHISLALH